MMRNVFILAFLLLPGAFTCYAQLDVGFGVQRLRGKNGRPLRLQLNAAAGGSTCDDEVETLIFDQAVVDNNRLDEQRFWSQRYFMNKRFWAGSGAPIFVFIGGEGEEGACRLSNRMYLYELAKEHHALLVDVEHRFYGRSMPTTDASSQSLSLLTSEQALADLARIIGHIKSNLNTESSRVITVGGSYPGNLAAWFREKYPTVTRGSISSSAPLFSKLNFEEYMDVVANSLEYFSGQKCVDSLAAAADKIASFYQQGIGSDGMRQLESDFKLCSPIGSKLDVAVLLSDLMGNIQGTIQYNREHEGALNATDICTTLTKSSDSYRNFVDMTALYRSANGQQCEDASWFDTINFLANSSLAIPANAARSWTWQTCTAFGYFQTATSANQPFYSWRDLLNLDFYKQICKSAFQLSTEVQTEWMNEIYGGRAPDISNVVFTSGQIDPWHALGVTNFTQALPQKTAYAVYIEGTAHCADLYAPKADDPESLTYSRGIVAQRVREFLA